LRGSPPCTRIPLYSVVASQPPGYPWCLRAVLHLGERTGTGRLSARPGGGASAACPRSRSRCPSASRGPCSSPCPCRSGRPPARASRSPRAGGPRPAPSPPPCGLLQELASVSDPDTLDQLPVHRSFIPFVQRGLRSIGSRLGARFALGAGGSYPGPKFEVNPPNGVGLAVARGRKTWESQGNRASAGRAAAALRAATVPELGRAPALCCAGDGVPAALAARRARRRARVGGALLGGDRGRRRARLAPARGRRARRGEPRRSFSRPPPRLR